ncbi:MAG: HAMP domain-containing histidine kinase [Comamonadaceae bacterium]|nr:MAG: HAMP domain-containing histidine kinase [Comamonadaceae bacterium]
MWAITGTWLGTGVSVLVVMFFGVQIRFARRNLRTFEESFRIRLENVELARRLAAEREELALARDAAVRADLAKSQFLASASHDLRQPLQAMSLNMGELSRLQARAEATEIARDVRASIDDLRSMLDGLLDVSKLDAGTVRVELRAVQLGRLVEGVCQSFRPSAVARGLALEVSCPPGLAVRTDPELLRRILANLVDNALKFTEQGAVRVMVREEGMGAIVEVRDTGRGIAPESQARVFDDLVQLGNPERNSVHGHGLGMGIVRRLAVLLDIPLRLESEVGQGTAFFLRLACLRPSACGPCSRAWAPCC